MTPADETAAEAQACAREYGLAWWFGFAGALHGWAVAQTGEAPRVPGRWEEGVAQIRESLDAHRDAGARTFRSIGQALLAESYLLRDQHDAAADALDEGLAIARETGEGLWEGELHRLHGETARLRGADRDAEEHFERAITVARGRQEKSLELRALMSLYRLVRAHPDVERAERVRARLAETFAWFTEGFETMDLRQARSLLSMD